jgi:hypothetical protein
MTQHHPHRTNLPDRTLVKAAAIWALSLLFGSEALAVPPKPLPPTVPFPKSSSLPSVSHWLVKYTHMPPSAVVALSDDVVFAVLPYRGHQAPGRLRMVLDAEVIRADYVPTFGGRSGLLSLEVSCETRGVRMLSLTTFVRPGLRGQATHGTENGAWVKPPPRSAMEGVWRSICDPNFEHPFPPQ